MNNLFSDQLNRRDFLTRALSFAVGVPILAALPSTAEATTLSEFKAGIRNPIVKPAVEPVVEQPASSYAVGINDNAVIGEETLGVEDIILRETHLDFVRRLQRRPRTNAVVIHHVGNTNADINAATIHRWHRQNGWAGIGYHYIVRKDGTIERGRPIDAVGAHAYSHNDHTVGICLVGNFDLNRPTYEQYRAVGQLVGAVCRVYDIEPNVRTVLGHKDLCRTNCPGINLYRWLPEIIRNAV